MGEAKRRDQMTKGATWLAPAIGTKACSSA